jgi:hypothetical protein
MGEGVGLFGGQPTRFSHAQAATRIRLKGSKTAVCATDVGGKDTLHRSSSSVTYYFIT